MGGRGNGAARNSSNASTREENTSELITRENFYGFEVEDSDYPVVEFSDKYWEEMLKLHALGKFYDPDLADLVDNRISDLVKEYDDLERYNADLTTLIEKLEYDGITNDEYWAIYQSAARMLGIKSPRYTVLDENGYAWDERYGSVEQAETWANEHSEAKYVYDTWTRKMKKIGGKNWRK